MDSGNTVVGFPISLCTVQGNILQSFFECQLRGLRHSCKWLTDLLWSLNLPIISSPDSVFSSSNVYQSIPPDKLTTFLLARSCFDTQEYDHCAEILSHNFEKPIHDNPNSFVDKYGHVYYFMYIYSRYMACEKRRVNDSVESRLVLKQDEEAKSSTMCLVRCNKELLSIKCEIEPYTNKISLSNEKRTKNNKIGDSFLLYVHALICLRLGIKETAATLLVQAIDLNFYLWPAWYELVDLIENKEKMNSLNLPTNDECWMRYFFEAKVFLKLHEGERALEILLKLSESGFSKSHNLQAEIGLAYNELRAMELAKKQFKQLFNACPCRLDNVDTYSNVLFVCEDSTELAYLAHHCVNLDRYRAETCCVIGNFFGLRGQHEKAVIYFRRALKLKTAYSLVWTLVGHEYMELRNTNAAIHAYKQALVYNRHDYRAWYGLGQMYEVLNMLSFALYYYREAQYLMPTDSRLIVALGEIYVRLKRFDEAKKCYWRAYCVGDIEGEALMRLATCFERCGEDAEAAAAYTEFIKLSQRNGMSMKAEGSEISRTEVMKSSAKEIQPLSISLKQALTSFSESTVLKKRFYLTKQTVPSSTAVTNQLDHLSSSVYCNSDGNGDHSNNDRNCSRNIPLDTTTSSMELVTTGITTPLHHSHPPPLPPCDTESFNHTTCETPINNVTSTGVHSEFRNSLASSVDNEQFNALLSEHRDESMVISENDDA
ncbi:Cell division cycle protein 23 like [Schistosoma japonicum]|nr:Cell division cycle protein 23 like [Schistosoma japonicum]